MKPLMQFSHFIDKETEAREGTSHSKSVAKPRPGFSLPSTVPFPLDHAG